MSISTDFTTVWTKLKAEWKTFALAISTTVIGIWDIVASYGYDYTTLIKDDYRKYVIPALGISFLALRKWTQSAVVDPNTDKSEAPETPEVK